MIKVNLLNSVTDRPKSSVAIVETKISDPRTQTWVLAAAVFSLMAIVMVFDYMTANSDSKKAQAELQKQQQIAQQMAVVNREQADLDKKTKETKARIEAIQKLRATQRGPVAVLSAINERIPQLADFRLESIEQKGEELVIRGDSPNEAAVTQFGRSLEFSSGLFANVNLETQRKNLEAAASSEPSADGANAAPAPKPETVSFTIKCKYSPPQPTSANATAANVPTATTASQIAQR
ncbi:MAG: PilN domain-containing protein [Pyrinomonadaceae bacterium]|nr:PilN domain-containing protein [Pyrinomonadaceae bacterium]